MDVSGKTVVLTGTFLAVKRNVAEVGLTSSFALLAHQAARLG
jgi:hypothetical protein